MTEHAETAVHPVLDYYDILQVDPDAEAAVVDLAYWHLARRYSREMAAEPAARERLEELNHAYEVLGLAASRDRYDEERRAALNAGTLVAPDHRAPETAPPQSVATQESHEESAPSAGPIERDLRRLQLPRPSGPRLRRPSWPAVACAGFVIALTAVGHIFGVQPVLIIALLCIAFVTTAVRLVRGELRLPALPAWDRAAAQKPITTRPQPRVRTDPDGLRRSTEAMLKRWHEAADGLSGGDPLAAVDQRLRSLARRDG